MLGLISGSLITYCFIKRITQQQSDSNLTQTPLFLIIKRYIPQILPLQRKLRLEVMLHTDQLRLTLLYTGTVGVSACICTYCYWYKSTVVNMGGHQGVHCIEASPWVSVDEFLHLSIILMVEYAKQAAERSLFCIAKACNCMGQLPAYHDLKFVTDHWIRSLYISVTIIASGLSELSWSTSYELQAAHNIRGKCMCLVWLSTCFSQKSFRGMHVCWKKWMNVWAPWSFFNIRG